MNALGTHIAEVEQVQVLDAEPSSDLRVGVEMMWFVDLLGRLPRGANLLMAGDPGVGKSTLAQQLALAAARSGERVLLIATEQSLPSIAARMQALTADVAGLAGIDIIDDIGDLALLPQFLLRQILSASGRYHGTTLVLLDSVHGGGNGPSDRRFYQSLFEYFRNAAAAGVTTFALAHMTKDRRMAGPKSLEHMIDVALTMKHGINCRSLFIPKNRFGPSITEPVSLDIDRTTTRLEPAPLTGSSSARVWTISPEGPVPIEVALAIPRHDCGYVKAPGLSKRDIETIVDVLARVYPPARVLPGLGITVRAPADVHFRRDMALAVAVAIAAALGRCEVPEGFIAIGDIDLRGNLCAPGASTLRLVDGAYTAGLVGGETFVSARIVESYGIDTGAWKVRPVANIIEALEACGIIDATGSREGCRP